MTSFVRWAAILAIHALLSTTGFAQTSSLALASVSAAPGSSAVLALTLASGSGNAPAAVQWTVTYDPSAITGITVTAGSSATAAAKSVQCAGGGGSYSCLAFGLNANPIADGLLATVTVNLAPAAIGSVSIGLSNSIGASPSSASIALTGAPVHISVLTPVTTPPPIIQPPVTQPPVTQPPVTSPPVTPPVTTPPVTSPPVTSPSGNPAPSNGANSISGLTCDPTTLMSGATASCSVTLSQPAPSGGISVALFSSSSALQASPAVTVPGAASSASFSISAAAISANTTAVLSAALNGSVQRLSISIAGVPAQAPPPQSPPGPVISGIPAGVVDAASYSRNIAPGSIFVVKGSHLAPDGVVQAAGYPLATTLNGTSIAFSPASGGAPVAPFLIYTSGQNGNSQLAAILPSAATPGTYNVTVSTNGAVSAAVPVTVVPQKLELFTADSSGTGQAVLQVVSPDGTYAFNRFTAGTVSGSAAGPAHPGDFIIAYGTGLGAIPNGDQAPSGPVDFTTQTPIQVLVAGQAIAPLYAGRAPAYPGLDQINFQLPANIPTGCSVTLQVSVAGQLSDPVTIAIAPSGAATCGPSALSGDVLTRLDQGGTLTMADFWLTQLSPASPSLASSAATVNEAAAGAFVTYSGFQLASAAPLLNPPGSCQLFHRVGSAAQLSFGAAASYLDAGTLTLTGPGISGRQFAEDSTRTYSLLLGSAGAVPAGLALPFGFPSFDSAPAVGAGAYQLAGSGGAGIGAFSASVTMGQPLNLSAALPQSVDRTKDLTLSWTGGGSSDLVSATGISGTIVGGTAGAPIYDALTFTCTATASAGSLTIPASLLAQFPATPATGGIGFLAVTSGNPPTPGNGQFTAPLVAGGAIDAGYFLGTSGTFAAASYQ